MHYYVVKLARHQAWNLEIQIFGNRNLRGQQPYIPMEGLVYKLPLSSSSQWLQNYLCLVFVALKIKELEQEKEGKINNLGTNDEPFKITSDFNSIIKTKTVTLECMQTWQEKKLYVHFQGKWFPSNNLVSCQLEITDSFALTYRKIT